MRIAVTAEPDGGGVLQSLSGDGEPDGPPVRVSDLAAAVAARERADEPRWVWSEAGALYAGLVQAGVRVRRCHDVALTEALLLAYDGRFGEPSSLAAAWARLHGLPAPSVTVSVPSNPLQPALFEPDVSGLPPGVTEIEAIVAIHRAQLRRLTAVAAAGNGLGLLAAVESAGGLAAVEMGEVGLPWRADIHDAVLTDLLGPRPPAGMLPRRLAGLAARVDEAFGHPVNVDSPAAVVRAFARCGIAVPSTRAAVLRGVDHPAVPLLLEYKELARLYTANGWSWLESWVRDGRFHPDYVAGGVVSGRWATRGGGALQIPRTVRRAVVADPGWSLVVADAEQLEPRVLAALADDRRLAHAASGGDLYAALAADTFGGDRAKAKVAMLAAMYGQTSGAGAALLAAMRRRFPDAIDYVERAASAGERGEVVRSRLGRTCPAPSTRWRQVAAGAPPEGGVGSGDGATDDGLSDGYEGARDRSSGQAVRARGRFTRNFVVQASAADWALTMLAGLRLALRSLRDSAGAVPELVFFQHDEVIVHCPDDLCDEVAAAVVAAGERAGRLVFGEGAVRFPVKVAVVECYADAK